MRPKIKVLARDDVQLRVFARNNAIPTEKVTRIIEARQAQELKPDFVFCLPKWTAMMGARKIGEEWKRRGGKLVDVPVAVVLGREKMVFVTKGRKP